MKEVINDSIENRLRIIRINLRMVNRSITELEYVTSNYEIKQAVATAFGFDEYYIHDYINIHSRNAVILLHSLINGQINIVNIAKKALEDNLLSKKTRLELHDAYNCLIEVINKYSDKLNHDRNKIQAHVDRINLLIGKYDDISILYIHEMKELYEAISNVYREVHSIYTNRFYEQFEFKPTIDFIITKINSYFDVEKKEMDKKTGSD